MSRITLSLDLSLEEASAILDLLKDSRKLTPNVTLGSLSEPQSTEEEVSSSEPVKEASKPAKTKVKPTVKPTAGKTVTMPSFGRSQEQIDEYNDSEESRVTEKTLKEEDAQLKRESRRKDEKKKLQEVAEILESEPVKVEKIAPPKLWEL